MSSLLHLWSWTRRPGPTAENQALLFCAFRLSLENHVHTDREASDPHLHDSACRASYVFWRCACVRRDCDVIGLRQTLAWLQRWSQAKATCNGKRNGKILFAHSLSSLNVLHTLLYWARPSKTNKQPFKSNIAVSLVTFTGCYYCSFSIYVMLSKD